MGISCVRVDLDRRQRPERVCSLSRTSRRPRVRELQIPDELALAGTSPDPWLSPADRKNIADGEGHFYAAMDAGFFVQYWALPKLAWFEYLSGNTERSLQLLDKAAGRQKGQPRALTLYYRGAILNRSGQYEEALTDLDQALAERPDLVLALEEKGESLWQLAASKRQYPYGAMRSPKILTLSSQIINWRVPPRRWGMTKKRGV